MLTAAEKIVYVDQRIVTLHYSPESHPGQYVGIEWELLSNGRRRRVRVVAACNTIAEVETHLPEGPVWWPSEKIGDDSFLGTYYFNF